MSSSGRHQAGLSQYLDKRRKQQKQGYASPNKQSGSARQGPEMPNIDKLEIRDSSSSSSKLGTKRDVSSSSSRGRAEGASPGKTKTSSRGPRLPLRPAHPVRTFKRKATMEDLPTELLLHVLSFLRPSDLLTCACVNRQWLELASDNILWQPLYDRYASQPAKKSASASAKTDSPSKPHPVYTMHADIRWKKVCITESIKKRNSRITSMLKKKHPFSLLPSNTESAIKKLGIVWELVFTDADKKEHSFTHSDAFPFHVSSTVRWYSLDPPPISSLRCLAVYARTPILFSKDGTAASGSPCQRSLLLEQRVKPSDLSGDPVIPSEAINVYTLTGGIIIATWKEGGEIAFVSLCLHHNNIIQRATLGTSDRMHIPRPMKPRPDDIDPEYGLHDYTCIMELRNQRVAPWNQQFLRIHANKLDKVDGFVRLSPVRADVITDHSYTSRKIQFPWKTDVFKGIIKDFAILDCIICNEFQQPMWCISSPVSIATDDRAPVTMEYEGDPYVIRYSDHKGNVDIRMIWIPEREHHMIVAVNIDLALKAVNNWFGTSYK